MVGFPTWRKVLTWIFIVTMPFIGSIDSICL